MKMLPQFLFVEITSVLLFGVPVAAESSCYMMTTSGRQIDLAGMCSSPSKNSAQPTATPSPTRPQSSSPTTPRATSESFLMNEGKGGYEDARTGIGNYYHYQVWSNASNTQYTLKVWYDRDYPGGFPITRQTFRSGREALDHFDCYYARKPLPSCPQQRSHR